MTGKSQRILVTGGAGYLGSILVSALLEAGHRVTVLETFHYDRNALNPCCASPNFDVLFGDARDEAVLAPLVEESDVIIPLAALVGAPLCDRDRIGATTTNRDAVATLCGLMIAASDSFIPR